MARIHNYYGQLMHIMFETSTDLTQFMPKGLTPVDPHKAFIKAERIKMRSEELDKNPPAFTQYQQICITTMARAPGFDEPRHRNILMWEDRHWAIGSSMVASKRYGGVEMTQVYEPEHALIAAGQPVPWYVDVQDGGYMLMHFAGVLDGKKRDERPAYSGFFVGGETPASLLQALTLNDHALTRPLYGTGELHFGASPIERSDTPGLGSWPATMIKDVKVTGCELNDLMFVRSYGGEMTPVKVS